MTAHEWTPIGHRPPLPRIETAPSYTPAPEPLPRHIEQQLAHVEKMARIKEGERVWQTIVETARST